jgi:hypothetical protein
VNARAGLLAVVVVVAVTGTGLANGAAHRLGLINGGTQIRRGSITGDRLHRDTLTGKQIKESTLGKVPRASLADQTLHADAATSADSANHALTADSSGRADSASRADSAASAGDAATIGGRRVIGLTGDMPTGTTDVDIGHIGPFTLLGSCGSGGSNQAVSFKVQTTAPAMVRIASRQAFPDQTSSASSSLAAGGTFVIINALFEYVDGGLTLTSGDRTYSGAFTATYSVNGGGCMIAGTVVG